MPRKPKVNNTAEKELDKLQNQFEDFDRQVKELSDNVVNKGEAKETEQQTLMSKREIREYDAPVLKPSRSIGAPEKPNPAFSKLRESAWELVKVIVENEMVIGETVECWTKEFPGDNADFWQIPVNKPIYIPRLLARNLEKCKYSQLKMDESAITGQGDGTQYYGKMVVEEVVKRISCRPAETSFSF